jgi:hypothetical protein
MGLGHYQIGIAEKLVQLLRGDELVPVVGSGRHEVQHVLGRNDGSQPRSCRPGVNVIKLSLSVIDHFRNELECLSLASLWSRV